ncbi:MAG: SIS domain-containing protein [Anaerolineales bacterium]|nr:SIS domain-containing protein [Anaerolineales bacterium]
MKTHFETEIYAQPDVLRALVENKAAKVTDIVAQIKAHDPSFVMIAARGTSDNAATYGKYLFSAFNQTPVALAAPSLYTLYQQPPNAGKGLVVGISQSGETPDVMAVLKTAKQQGAPLITITNIPGSPMDTICDNTILLDAGVEKSVPASKTYTAQMAAIAMLSVYWNGDKAMLGELNRLGDLVAEVLEQHETIKQIAQRFTETEYMVVVGRGFTHCATYEIALKIKESTYVVAQAFSAADFRHGPIAILDPGFPVIAVAPKGKSIGDMREMVSQIQERDADLVLISNDDELCKQVDSVIRLPAHLPEWLAPIVATVPGQLLALELALAKGIDVDSPRGLHKVTYTL